ncbi:crossover junction endodeoxyribonuclease RuvC [Candidatus Saccharibacteria bacterium]|nr:crossover junction endodeoxyribonuclease RuvC [Candidatus Saccharibacteria bacterium]
MVVLGVDPGTATTGFGLVDFSNRKPVAITHGVIRTKPDTIMADRLKIIASDLEELVRQYKPDAVAVEELFFANNAKTAIAVGQARGVILLTLAQANYQVYEYTPLQVKLAIAGYGRASKRQVQEMVKRLLQLSDLPKPDDAADGLAIALTHYNFAKRLDV